MNEMRMVMLYRSSIFLEGKWRQVKFNYRHKMKEISALQLEKNRRWRAHRNFTLRAIPEGLRAGELRLLAE